MPLMDWMKKKDGAEHQLEISMSDEDKKKLDTASAAASELPKIKEMLEGLIKIQSDSTAAAKKERDDAERVAAAKKALETNGTHEEQIEALMLEGKTREAIQLATQGTNQAILLLNADNVKRNTFENQEKFKYYHGELKDEVDKLIAAQNLQARNDSSVVENCYLTVLGRHNDDIVAGKLKSRFASSSGGSTSSGGTGGTGTEEKKGIDPNDADVKKAAKLLGFKPEEYAKMLDAEGIGYA